MSYMSTFPHHGPLQPVRQPPDFLATQLTLPKLQMRLSVVLLWAGSLKQYRLQVLVIEGSYKQDPLIPYTSLAVSVILPPLSLYFNLHENCWLLTIAPHSTLHNLVFIRPICLFMLTMIDKATIELLFYVTERDSVKVGLKLKLPTARCFLLCDLPRRSSLAALQQFDHAAVLWSRCGFIPVFGANAICPRLRFQVYFTHAADLFMSLAGRNAEAT